jgi:uncharacterized membrane protein
MATSSSDGGRFIPRFVAAVVVVVVVVVVVLVVDDDGWSAGCC